MNQGDLVAGRYRLLRPIGAGAMGTVWAARHELLGRDFALKLATVPDRAGPEARARFLREARIVGKLRHPNVVDVADVGDVAPGGGLYLAMELLEGQSLAERITSHGPLDVPIALAIASEVCRGLGAAHAAGIIHRDIKPENIFLARGGGGGVIPKLLDFGISKATAEVVATPLRTGAPSSTSPAVRTQVFGTPAYMSPEQALGEVEADQRSDLWSMGVVMYEMLTGTHPFAADSYVALMHAITEVPHEPLPPAVPREVRAIVDRCLAKDPDARYVSADALRADIERARVDLGVRWSTGAHPAAATPPGGTPLATGGSPIPVPSPTTSDLFIEAGVAIPSILPRPPRESAPEGRPSAPEPRRSHLFAAIAAVFAVLAAVVVWRSLAGGTGNPDTHVGASTSTSATAPAPEPSASVSATIAPAPPPPAAASSPVEPTAKTPPPHPSGSPGPRRTPARPRPGGVKPVTSVDSAGF